MARSVRARLAPLGPRTSLRETVVLAVRGAIVSGEMAPGVVYSVPSLGAKFGVSPTPVREAMLDLVKEGLVTVEPNKGFRVTEVSDADLDHITQLRLLLEPPLVRDATGTIPARDFTALRAQAETIVHWAQRGDLPRYMEADRVFHLRLVEYAGNPRITALLSDLRSQTRLLGLRPLLERGVLASSAHEHVDLVDLMAERRAEAAEELMRRHIGHVRGIWAAPVAEEAGTVAAGGDPLGSRMGA